VGDHRFGEKEKIVRGEYSRQREGKSSLRGERVPYPLYERGREDREGEKEKANLL